MIGRIQLKCKSNLLGIHAVPLLAFKMDHEAAGAQFPVLELNTPADTFRDDTIAWCYLRFAPLILPAAGRTRAIAAMTSFASRSTTSWVFSVENRKGIRPIA